MSWRKPRRPEDAVHYPGRMEVEEFVYTPGLHGLEQARALVEDGSILGMRCGDRLIVPPLTFCPDHTRGELVRVESTWRLHYYTVLYETPEGEPLPEPEIVGLVRPDGFEGGLFARIAADPSRLYPGVPVRPVLRPKEERRGTIEDILYWEPLE